MTKKLRIEHYNNYFKISKIYVIHSSKGAEIQFRAHFLEKKNLNLKHR